MNFRGYAGYVSYVQKIENKVSTSDFELNDDDNNLYSNSNNSEENENQTSNYFEILEKLDIQSKYCLDLNDFFSGSKIKYYYHLELYSLLKSSLTTPPPEYI